MTTTVPELAVLDEITPSALRALGAQELPQLASDLRRRLVETVSIHGGHLGPNLGVVELTIALHRTFESPREAIVFDTGHQAYVHKMLTGRTALAGLRREGGTSGYPSREESAHDVVENSHASGSIAWAHGIDRANRLSGRVACSCAVIGDGAMTGGVALEALNELGGDRQSRTLVVLNDNGRSYAPTVGGLATHLYDLRTGRIQAGQDIFTSLGLRYIGPVDGHDLDALNSALATARAGLLTGEGPMVIHVLTKKGYGYARAEQDVRDHLHATGPFPLDSEPSQPAEGATSAPSADADPGMPLGLDDEKIPAPAPANTPRKTTWTDVFSEAVCEAAEREPALVAISAAMVDPVGLSALEERYPDRVIDVGIAEQLAVDTAAGLSRGGAKPLLALYSTFLTRAIDQVLMDVALHREPVTFTLDRSGVTGDDGPSHHGIWDLGLACQVPGLSVWAPRDASRLRAALSSSLALTEGPGLVRFPKGAVTEDLPAIATNEAGDTLHGDDQDPIVLIGYGSLLTEAVEAATALAREGIRVQVIDPVQALPHREALIRRACEANVVLTLEDGVASRGVGAAFIHQLVTGVRPGQRIPLVRTLGVPQEFISHANRSSILMRCGLDAQGIADSIREVSKTR
ncbi:1-deoxy-D-xylulose-5-phosphate synthase [Devriesea agamarum]|uniref:1-deoxy-D-xylulose-5-phosphate synthase n=1 Tax=Devriesea agamarum TaxID=472569 RepID=UPI00071CD124|nr:1-deoxy-D-xylulose-5-phosphate synthase [Devriesea agamarum]